MKNLKLFTWIVLINIYLVIIAGSVVRMTGSGMGCPDWPKCFGYWVPPTDEAQIQWEENTTFEKGQIIIKEEALVVAKEDFVSADSFNQANWENYTRHDYAIFNVYHTWTEYINRLFGALLGFFALFMVYFTFKKWKINKAFAWLALAQLFLIGFEAWLGKLTVDTHLDANVITYHMLGVTIMVVVQLLLLKLINREVSEKKWKFDLTNSMKKVALIGIVLMIIQIVLGTEVRQQTDVMTDAGIARNLIPDGFDYIFLIHRSFSILIVIAVGYLYNKLNKKAYFAISVRYLVLFTLLEIFAGIILYYFNMQAFAQPIHLLLSILIFSFFVEIYLRMNAKLHSI